ncbi:MAG TPA: CRISPR-associated endonuclease Cas2, partial [Spirochaetota bacterium]|nr:CRISPR-associated endonuclease Cas2 [Spirochaetota bacterium]
MTYIVAYDIENDKVRGKLARFLEKNGLRLQKSVFAIDSNAKKIKEVQRGISRITGGKGKIALFPLCANCASRSVKIDDSM